MDSNNHRDDVPRDWAGDEWQGRHPTDFAWIRVQYQNTAAESIPDWQYPPVPGWGCKRNLLVPINWTGQPVPTENGSWGSVKSKLEGKDQ